MNDFLEYFEKKINDKTLRIFFHIAGIIIGIIIGSMALFNGLFLLKVLPHGGL